MKSSKSDSSIKKTLVRNCDQKVNKNRDHVTHETDSQTFLPLTDKTSRTSQKENALHQPSLCSSDIYFHYLNDVKKTSPPRISIKELDLNERTVNTKILEPRSKPSALSIGSQLVFCVYLVTKKLNFHFNDRMYRNLIELNTSIDKVNKKDKKLPRGTGKIKRDLEPNIEEFFDDEEEDDYPPNIPVLKPKFKPVRHVEDGHLHKLVASFENL